MCVYIYKKNMFIIPVHSRNVSLNVTYGNYIVVLLYDWGFQKMIVIVSWL